MVKVQPKPTILYTEDTRFLYEPMVNSMEILLNAAVHHTDDNAEAEELFRSGKRFDAYIFDDSAGGSGAGHGISLTMQIAKALALEGRGGIVIAASSSNAEILTGNNNRIPFTLTQLKQNNIEFWYKHTEGFKMLLWLATCIKENRQITREEWLRSVDESINYQTFGRRDELEQGLSFLSSTNIKKSLTGAYYRIDIPTYVRKVRSGNDADGVLRDLLYRSPGKPERGL